MRGEGGTAPKKPNLGPVGRFHKLSLAETPPPGRIPVFARCLLTSPRTRGEECRALGNLSKRQKQHTRYSNPNGVDMPYHAEIIS